MLNMSSIIRLSPQAQRHWLGWQVMDDTYEQFIYGSRPHIAVNRPHILHIFSFSKVWPLLVAGALGGCPSHVHIAFLTRQGSENNAACLAAGLSGNTSELCLWLGAACPHAIAAVWSIAGWLIHCGQAA